MMSEKKLLFVLLLFGFYASAQIKGVVKDSLSGEPIPYVNIWVENESIGTTSEENGSFSLDIKEEKVLVFSALGYESKKLSSKNELILLKPKVFELKEVVVSSAKKNKTIKVNSFKKNKIKVFYGAGAEPTIIAKKIEPTDQIIKHPYLKEINFISLCQLEKAKLVLRFFEIDADGKPGDDYLGENIIIIIKKGQNLNKLNLEKYNIRIPDKGFFIAFEFLTIEENKYTFKNTQELDGKIIKKEFVYFEPVIGTTPTENQNSYQYTKGIWYKRGKFSNVDKLTAYQNKFGELAIELILTN
jgi:hypothetical protein